MVNADSARKDTRLSPSHSGNPDAGEAYFVHLLHSMIYIARYHASHSTVSVLEGRRGRRARAISFDLKVSPATLWNYAALAVLHIAFLRKVSAFDSRPCLGALCAPVVLSVAAWAKDGFSGALRVVGPIAVLSLAPLAGVFLQSLRYGLLIVARYAHSYRNHPIKL